MAHGKFEDLTGKRFARLTVIKRVENTSYGYVCWLCKCDCGNLKSVTGDCLKERDTQSCGCLQKEVASSVTTIHGLSCTPEYQAYHCMLQRCYNPKHPQYKYWGGRGIKVCDHWRGPDGFRHFIEDMGPRLKGLTLERKNNTGGYESGNCCWATAKEQAVNRRDAKDQRWFAATKVAEPAIQFIFNNQNEFARMFGLSDSCINNCLKGKQDTHKDWSFQYISKMGGG